MMKMRLFLIMLFLLMAFPALADDKETLALKQSLATERVMRLQTELELLRSQFRERQELLKSAAAELEKLNAGAKSGAVDDAIKAAARAADKK